MRDKREWQKPTSTAPSLKLYNSLTKSKDDFIPNSGKFVGWYSCGPTVYNWSHLGHARNYMSFDILRRILQDYFAYDVLYVMNITDIDDKIIIGARQEYLFNKYKEGHKEITPSLIKDIERAWSDYVQKHLLETPPPPQAQAIHPNVLYDERNSYHDHYISFATYIPPSAYELEARFVHFIDEVGKNGKPKDAGDKFNMYLKSAKAAFYALKHTETDNQHRVSLEHMFDASKDVLQPWLDSHKKSTVADPKIFRDFAAYWEDAYFADMDALNIRRPDVLTRVSEYVPEIVEWTQKIMTNGFAYELEGSVYFDTTAFNSRPNHAYAKLSPSSASNLDLIAEAEGSLSSTTIVKRSLSDFALWKASKPGEPAWPSPWGQGRPGWHIECSTMASEVLGDKFDIHTGGQDLLFPHHDNEIAQSEAYYDHSQWVNYFMHAGHLHIEGMKMSKSLKNFITIREALEKHTATQIRYMFLMHSWNSLLDYAEGSMNAARDYETTVTKFLTNTKAVIKEVRSAKEIFTGTHNYRDDEKKLTLALKTAQASIHAALCDSFDTPKVMRTLSDLITSANIYMSTKIKDKTSVLHADMLDKVATYVRKMLRIFGIFSEVGDGGGVNGVVAGGVEGVEDAVDAEMRILSGFRDRIRELARQKGDNQQLKEEVERIKVLAPVKAAYGVIKPKDPRAPYLNVLTSFIDAIESLANGQRPHSEFLALCDSLRDNQLADLGVALDDREDGTALVKFVNPDDLKAQREEKRLKELDRIQKKEEAALVAAAKRAEKLAKGAVAPAQMFRSEENAALYSRWDEKNIPTHDVAGVELPKAKLKKLQKEYDGQVKLHEEYLKEVVNGNGKQ